MSYYTSDQKCEACESKSKSLSMKGRKKCMENDCGEMTSLVTDKAVNGALSNWLQLFEYEKLRKGAPIEDSVVKALEELSRVVNDVKKMSHYENLSMGSVFDKIAPLFQARQYTHYLF
jgi:hypothetical protein